MKKIIINERQAKVLKLGKLIENQNLKNNRVDKEFKREFSGKDIKGMLDEETKEFVKYLYKETKNLSPFWEKNNLSFETICKNLKDKKILNQRNGLYEISKSIGEPKTALKRLKEELSKMIGETPTYFDNHMLYGDDNYRETNYTKPLKIKNKRFETLYYNDNITAILKEIKTENYFLFNGDRDYLLKDDEFRQFCTIEIEGFGDEIDGGKYEIYGDEIEYDADSISNYVTLYFDRLIKNSSQYEELIVIDSEVKKELMEFYSNDSQMLNILAKINLNDDKEVVDETTTAASSGQYTASAFSMKSPTEFSNEKPKAFKKTQYAGGGFVKFKDECVKLNNKPAGAGCSQGAVDNIVSVYKTKGNINAPSVN